MIEIVFESGLEEEIDFLEPNQYIICTIDSKKGL